MMKILEARDERVKKIESLLEKNNVVISLRCNYPGANKDNIYTRKVIRQINALICKRFHVKEVFFLNHGEGPSNLYTIKTKDSSLIKKKMMDIEDDHPLGRLVDIDVYSTSIKSLSRRDFKKEQRQCFLCDRDAFDCMVSKRHSLGELMSFYSNRVRSYEKNKWCLDIIEYTNQAMLYELHTHPSFGLVSPFSVGAHKDMNHFTFIDSLSVLNKYMVRFAELGYQEQPINYLLDEAIQIGRSCEIEMYEKTKGVNTHKGLIFVLGTLVMSVMKMIYDDNSFDSVFRYSSLLTQTKLNELNQLSVNRLSNGERAYLKHKIAGVRKEAALGFPIIQEALNTINLDKKETLVITLMQIMSHCDDTTIINRKGLEGLKYVKQTMQNLLSKGYDENEVKKIEYEFIKQGISPGGSADLLCGTIFLSLIKNKWI